jgi:hypothetical protein
MEAELKAEVEVIADANTAKQREAMIKQKEREIQEAKVRAQKTAGTSKDSGGNSSQPTSSSPQQPPDPSSTPSQPPGSKQSSAARDDWETQERLLGEHNDTIDSIMAMAGLEAVKLQVLQTKEKLDLMRRQGVPSNREHLNLALLGNPGTGECSSRFMQIVSNCSVGKTTIARLYAQLLESIQILPGNAFKEITGASLAHDGVGGAKKLVSDKPCKIVFESSLHGIWIDGMWDIVHDES